MTDAPEPHMETIMIAGKELSWWVEFAQRDDCLDQMVPSDLRQLVGAAEQMHAALTSISDIGHISDEAGQFYAMLADKGLET